MKITYQIVGAQQFEYIMIEEEALSQEDAVERYNRLKEAFAGAKHPVGEGLEHKEWCMALDEYLTTNSLKDGSNIYEKMNDEQKRIMQEIKKAFKRITKE